MSGLPANPAKFGVFEEKIRMKKSIFLVFIALFLFACKDDDKLDLPEGTPTCIRDGIKSFKRYEAFCEGFQVSSFDTQIGKIYVFPHGDCIADGGTRYLDSSCNQICNIGGWGYDCMAGFDTLVFENEEILWHN
ncbi:MAG: hypothetical protein IPM82_03320 [Saprospiraceae bacterium]|nr:hypothetical protein [Saprospiraceae bacterium]